MREGWHDGWKVKKVGLKASEADHCVTSPMPQLNTHMRDCLASRVVLLEREVGACIGPRFHLSDLHSNLHADHLLLLTSVPTIQTVPVPHQM